MNSQKGILSSLQVKVSDSDQELERDKRNKRIDFYKQFYTIEHSTILVDLTCDPGEIFSQKKYHQTLQQFFKIIYSKPEVISILFSDPEFNLFYLKYINPPDFLFKPPFLQEIDLKVMDNDLFLINLQRIHCIALFSAYAIRQYMNQSSIQFSGLRYENWEIDKVIESIHDYFFKQLPEFEFFDKHNPTFVFLHRTFFLPCVLLCTTLQAMPQFYFLNDTISPFLTLMRNDCKTLLAEIPNEVVHRESLYRKIHHELDCIFNPVNHLRQYRAALATFIKGQDKELPDELKYTKKKLILNQCVHLLENNDRNNKLLNDIELYDVSIINGLKPKFGHVEAAIELVLMIEMLKCTFAVHTDTGITGFLKCTWARYPTNKNTFDTFLTNNPLPYEIQQIATVIQKDFHAHVERHQQQLTLKFS